MTAPFIRWAPRVLGWRPLGIDMRRGTLGHWGDPLHRHAKGVGVASSWERRGVGRWGDPLHRRAEGVGVVPSGRDRVRGTLGQWGDPLHSRCLSERMEHNSRCMMRGLDSRRTWRLLIFLRRSRSDRSYPC
jgi:hypothetical protein